MNAHATKQTRTDWDPIDIKYALAKKGYSLARISLEYGCIARNSANNVLHKPWSHMERIIAAIIGVRPAEIWPTRYDRRGKPLKERTARIRTNTDTIQNSQAVINV